MVRCVRALTHDVKSACTSSANPSWIPSKKGRSQRVRVAEEERREARVEKRHEKGQAVESAVPI